jgi:uncharacterized protein (TIGR02391 family)
MVPINFHQCKDKLRRVLLDRKDSLESEWDPFIAVWISYALGSDGAENNSPFAELCKKMLRWVEEGNLWEAHRNLGPVAATLYMCKGWDKGKKMEITAELSRIVQRLNADDRWSPLRDPEQVYLLALGLKSADEMTRNHLKSIVRHEIRNGPLRRRILYIAALKELGDEDISFPHGDPQDEGDVIAMVWSAERYGGDKGLSWTNFNSIKERIALEEKDASDTQRILSIPEIAMLYEAVTKETTNPDPKLLFENFPLHKRIKMLCGDHFKNGKFVSAVFEATKALNEKIQEVAGERSKSEVELVQYTMGSSGGQRPPLIRFNDHLHKRSGKNEQDGLKMIFEGVFKAFRHPKGHEPEDSEIVLMDAYEALEQLIIISYLMKLLDKASLGIHESN